MIKLIELYNEIKINNPSSNKKWNFTKPLNKFNWKDIKEGDIIITTDIDGSRWEFDITKIEGNKYYTNYNGIVFYPQHFKKMFQKHQPTNEIKIQQPLIFDKKKDWFFKYDGDNDKKIFDVLEKGGFKWIDGERIKNFTPSPPTYICHNTRHFPIGEIFHTYNIDSRYMQGCKEIKL